MKIILDNLEVLFPYDRMYDEQFRYMCELKKSLDAKGHCILEMPTGTGKTVAILSLGLSYKYAYPKTGKLIYCTRTVPEMTKCISELKKLVNYRRKYYEKVSSNDQNAANIRAVCLSSRRNMCIHLDVMANIEGETVDSQCRKKTASWIRAKAELVLDKDLCLYYEGLHSNNQDDSIIPYGVYSLDDLKEFGKKKRWCPYFLTRKALAYADVIVYNYQYMLDPKVSSMVSEIFEKESIVIFDEAHNIDNVCIEALSVSLDKRSLDKASRNLTTISTYINRMKIADKKRLEEEYKKLVDSIRSSNSVVHLPCTKTDTGEVIHGSEDEYNLHGSAVLPDDIINESVPGSIRQAEHFVSFMRRLIEYLRTKISKIQNVESESPNAFLHYLNQSVAIETRPMKFCYSRLNSLMRTLEITNIEDYNSLTIVADFATLVASYMEGFMLISEPAGNDMHLNEQVLQLACLDSSLAIRPVFERFSTVVITSGTLSPLDLYPRLLNFNPVIRESLPMSVYRSCICPLVVTRGSDQMPISTKFDLRDDISVVRNFASLLIEMVKCCPDGIVCFFPSYLYMENILMQWDSLGALKKVLSYKLLFIETKDIVETTLALDNYKKACDCGRGAVFLSVARGKVAEGIDFDRHYGRCVIMFGIPFQYTLSNILRARLEYLRYTHQINEGDFLTFDALRQAAQCAGRVIRSKTDYGLIIFADSRYNRLDKRTKLPPWILQFLNESHLNLSVDMAIYMAKQYLAAMAQPVNENCDVQSVLISEQDLQKRILCNNSNNDAINNTKSVHAV